VRLALDSSSLSGHDPHLEAKLAAAGRGRWVLREVEKTPWPREAGQGALTAAITNLRGVGLRTARLLLEIDDTAPGAAKAPAVSALVCEPPQPVNPKAMESCMRAKQTLKTMFQRVAPKPEAKPEGKPEGGEPGAGADTIEAQLLYESDIVQETGAETAAAVSTPTGAKRKLPSQQPAVDVLDIGIQKKPKQLLSMKAYFSGQPPKASSGAASSSSSSSSSGATGTTSSTVRGGGHAEDPVCIDD
jgi:hypothetical protein